MEITKVDINREEKGNCKGLARVTIDDCFVIHSIRIIDKDGQLFVAMPSKMVQEGVWMDVCHPIKKETREMFTNAILDAYRKQV